jgi:hypothetical protein
MSEGLPLSVSHHFGGFGLHEHQNHATGHEQASCSIMHIVPGAQKICRADEQELAKVNGDG